MTTATDITNRALSAIGAKNLIVNLPMDVGTEAQNARLIYAPTRDALLRSAPWNFARRVAPLSMTKAAPGTQENPTGATTWNPLTMPAIPWTYEYTYPSDCVFVRSVSPPPVLSGNFSPPLFSSAPYTVPGPLRLSRVRFEVANGRNAAGNTFTVINTDVSGALATYCARIEVEDLWDANFQEAMVASLALRLVMPLTLDADLMQLMARQALSAINTARMRDGNEGITQMNHVPDWITVRSSEVVGWGGDFFMPWETPYFLGAYV
jgi:hypothetical protein